MARFLVMMLLAGLALVCLPVTGVSWANELQPDSLDGHLFAGPTPEQMEELKDRGLPVDKSGLEALEKSKKEEERKKNAPVRKGPPKRFKAIGGPGGGLPGRPGLLPVGQTPGGKDAQGERGAKGRKEDGSKDRGSSSLKKGGPGDRGSADVGAALGLPAKKADEGDSLPVRELPQNDSNKPTKEGQREGFSEFQEGERYHLDYYDAELVDFIKQMSEKFKVNFILSDKVKGGKITIVSPNPVTREEAWQAFLSVLEGKNLTLVKIGQFYKILPRNEAGRSPIKTYLNGGRVDPTDEMITYLLKVQNIGLKEMESILKEMKSKEGQIVTFEPTNTMIITDSSVNIRRMAKIVRELDVPSGTDVIHVIDIYYAAASDVASSLQEIFGDKGKGGAKAKSSKKGSGKKDDDAEAVSLTNVISDERTNQLIIVAPRTAMPKILDLINRLDVPIPGDGQVHVYYCENANAEELAQTLTGLASGRGRSTTKGKGKAGTNSAELFEGEVKVTADKSTNSLVVVASTKDYNALKKVIQQLDIRRRQVFVEAVIMEVTLSKNRTLGMAINGGYSMNIGGETVPIYAATTLGSQSSIIMDPTTLSGLAVGLQGPELEGTEGMISGMDGGIPAFGVLLQMIQTDSDANVLSTPHILTMDNEEAEIIVGSNVPFITGSARDSNNQPVLSIQRQDVALSMKIKPQINESDYVRLEVNQEITELVSISETLGPTTTKRAAKSVVVVKDNQTIVIGGLLRDRETSDAEKVPFLGDLPVLGRLFRRDKEGKEKTNLLIFLTCHIIKDDEDFKRIFKRKMEERNEFLRRFYGEDDDYEFETDFTQKVGLVETIRATVEQEKVRTQKEDEQRQRELVITPDEGHNVYEIGMPRGKYQENSSDSSKTSGHAAEPKSTEVTPDELMRQLTSRPGKDRDEQ